MKKMLLEKYPYKIELHAHSLPASECSDVSPEELVRNYKEAGFDAMVLTNHFIERYYVGMTREEAVVSHLQDYERALAEGEKLNIKVLLGTEARFTENANDYLIYGVDAEILGKVYDYFGKGVEAFRNEVKLGKSVFIQAHPYRKGCEPADPALLDGVEVFNMHPNHNNRTSLVELMAQKNPHLIKTAGSDYHHPLPGYLGAGAIRTKVLPEDGYALAEILRSGDYIIETLDSIILP